MTLNDFPARFTLSFCLRKTDQPVSTQLNFSGFTTLPYIKDVSYIIKRIILETTVKVALKSFLTIGKFLPFLKELMNYDEKSSFVYEVPCQDCLYRTNQTKPQSQNNGTSTSNEILTAQVISTLPAFERK